MELSNCFKKTAKLNMHKIKDSLIKPEVPDGLIKRCNKCKKSIYSEEVKYNGFKCPHCNAHFRMGAKSRIKMLVDAGTFVAYEDEISTRNPLDYKGYEGKIEKLQQTLGIEEAVVTGEALIDGVKISIAVMDPRFMMASMGEVVGEKITRAVEKATSAKQPIIIVCCSGGARMQEGIVSLMQMAKTSAALKRHSQAGQLYISVLTDPTTGGVTASFAMLGDIIIAEPDALIGFAGPRVIEQTIGQKLPKEFQRAEFLQEKGFVDFIVSREHMKEKLGVLLRQHVGVVCCVDGMLGESDAICESIGIESTSNAEKSSVAVEGVDGHENEGVRNVSVSQVKGEGKYVHPWDRVLRSRAKDRPVASQYIEHLFSDFTEFHGDRHYGDDPSIIGGIGYFNGRAVTVIAQAKGSDTKENIERNFGMPSPEGYRKALRLMKQAEKFNRPVICLVDTPGAFCGMEAEERGQGEAIAQCIYEMSALETPVLSIVIGEGGSGGALALATSDEVWMLENSVYSILSPEGYSTILWKDSSRMQEAAKLMKMTAADLLEMGMIEKIIPEPVELNANSLEEVARVLEKELQVYLDRYLVMDTCDLVEQR